MPISEGDFGSSPSVLSYGEVLLDGRVKGFVLLAKYSNDGVEKKRKLYNDVVTFSTI